MKKSSLVVLTIVAALTISSCAVQKGADNLGPPDPVYAEQTSDTSRPVARDTTTTRYDYYYRSYFWDDMYRIFWPRRYYYVINQPDFRPRRLRPAQVAYAHVGHRVPVSGRRGGFGRSGSVQTGHS